MTTVVTVIDNGPIKIENAEVRDMLGAPIKPAGQVFLCRCGLSAGKPFCDGAHKGKFESKVTV